MTDEKLIPPTGTRTGDRPAGIVARAVKLWPVVAGIGGALFGAWGIARAGGESTAQASARIGALEFRMTAVEAMAPELRKVQSDLSYIRGGLDARFDAREKAAAQQAERETKAQAFRLRPLPGAP